LKEWNWGLEEWFYRAQLLLVLDSISLELLLSFDEFYFTHLGRKMLPFGEEVLLELISHTLTDGPIHLERKIFSGRLRVLWLMIFDILTDGPIHLERKIFSGRLRVL
jgi:hypothetical protein